MLCIDNVWIPLQLVAKLLRILTAFDKQFLLESSPFYMKNSSHCLGHQGRLGKDRDQNLFHISFGACRSAEN
jgi:hypothetical protein